MNCFRISRLLLSTEEKGWEYGFGEEVESLPSRSFVAVGSLWIQVDPRDHLVPANVWEATSRG